MNAIGSSNSETLLPHDGLEAAAGSRDKTLPPLPGPARWSGWRLTIAFGMCFVAAVLTANLAFYFWVIAKFGATSIDGVVKLDGDGGSCDSSKWRLFGAHLPINVCGAVLLAVSNSAMQIIMAPTREDIDRAHPATSLEVGILGYRNWKYSSTWRRVTMVLLALSSLPITLFYNSSIFSKTFTFETNVWTVTKGSVSGQSWTLPSEFTHNAPGCVNAFHIEQVPCNNISAIFRTSSFYNENKTSFDDNKVSYEKACGQTLSSIESFYNLTLNNESRYNSILSDVPIYNLTLGNESFYNLKVDNNIFGKPPYTICEVHENITSLYSRRKSLGMDQFERLEVPDCWEAFESPLPHSHATMFIVVNIPIPETPLLNITKLSYRSSPEFVPQKRIVYKTASGMKRMVAADHCLAEKAPHKAHCSLLLHRGMFLIVVGCISVKLACLVFISLQHKYHPLLTIGDAVASFMQTPEPATYNIGAVTERYLRKYAENHFTLKTTHGQLIHVRPAMVPEQPSVKSRSWSAGATRWRWRMCIYLVGQYVVIMSGFAGSAFRKSRGSIGGLGDFNTEQLSLRGENAANATPTWGLALVANLPQIALSGLYYLYNGLYTSMLLSREWTAFATRRQPLRVSRPIGHQRPTYWLTIPIPFAIPIVAAAALAHWLQAQAMSLVFVDLLDSDGRLLESIQGIGQSPLAWLVTVVTQAVMVFLLIGIGFFRYPGGIPLVRSCTMAISAACHPSAEEVNPAATKLKYGVLVDQSEGAGAQERVGLSSKPVSPLNLEKEYGDKEALETLMRKRKPRSSSAAPN